MLSIFSCASWPSVCLLWRNVLFQSSVDLFYLFVCFWILSSINRLYVLEINPFSVVSFENTFSHSEGCLFILFTVSFDVQKLLSLIKSQLFIFVFVSIILGGGSKISCCDLYQRVFFLCFPLFYKYTTIYLFILVL